MLLAYLNGESSYATETGQRGICPRCNEEVMSKCGKIITNHFAHFPGYICDTFKVNDGETEWHRLNKLQFPKKYQEVVIGEHRADIKINNLVVEFQNSSIDIDTIIAREEFYTKQGCQLIWVVNAVEFWKQISKYTREDAYTEEKTWFGEGGEERSAGGYYVNFRLVGMYRWKHIRPRTWIKSKCDIFLDFDNKFKRGRRSKECKGTKEDLGQYLFRIRKGTIIGPYAKGMHFINGGDICTKESFFNRCISFAQYNHIPLEVVETKVKEKLFERERPNKEPFYFDSFKYSVKNLLEEYTNNRFGVLLNDDAR
jgi:hypothetical protein